MTTLSENVEVHPLHAAVKAHAAWKTNLRLAAETGRYYDVGGKEVRPSLIADDVKLARTLWQKSAEWTGLPA